MAAPVITAFNAPPAAIAGTPFQVTVTAESGTAPTDVPFVITATDTATGEAVAQGFNVTVSDAFTVTLSSPDPSVSIVEDRATPGVFTVTVA